MILAYTFRMTLRASRSLRPLVGDRPAVFRGAIFVWLGIVRTVRTEV